MFDEQFLRIERDRKKVTVLLDCLALDEDNNLTMTTEQLDEFLQYLMQVKLVMHPPVDTDD